MGETPTSATASLRRRRGAAAPDRRPGPRARARARPPISRRTRRAIASASPISRSSTGPQVCALRASSQAPRSCAAISCSPVWAESRPQARRNRCSTAASPVQARSRRAASPAPSGSRPVERAEHLEACIAGRRAVLVSQTPPRRDCRCRRRGSRRPSSAGRSGRRRGGDLRARQRRNGPRRPRRRGDRTGPPRRSGASASLAARAAGRMSPNGHGRETRAAAGTPGGPPLRPGPRPGQGGTPPAP